MSSDQEPVVQGELRLRLLGGLSITLDGSPVRGFISSKTQALLCYLAVTGRTHSRELLIGLLWGDLPEERAAHGLRQALSNLQKLVGSHLVITRQTAALNLSAARYVDTEAFLNLLKQAEAGKRSASLGVHRRLREAVGLYAGDFLDGFYVRDAPDFDEWATAQRELLRQMALDALHNLAAYHSTRGEYSAASGYLGQLLSLDPWREDAHRHLMLLLAYDGKPDAAIAQYQICRRVLSQEFGEEPSEETTSLYRRIRAGELELPTPQAPAGNLPIQYEQLTGRRADLAKVETLLEDPVNRVVTLTGSGGVGKTRLALQIASDIAGDFEHGVFFVPLASISDPELALSTIASALGVEATSEQTVQQSLKVALRDKQMLLVLDNFEHLLAAAPQVAALTGDLLGLRILVTSRASLHVRGERVYEVVPLAVPPLQDPALAEVVSSFPAAALFAERARFARPDFAITDANARVVAEICHRLEGLPLAIELAAARLNIMPVQALLARLGNRLGILTGGPRDLPERQQTVRATIEWSYSLLDRQEKELFARLSVFAGGCTLEAVEAVCGMRNAEWGMRNEDEAGNIPNSEFPIPHSDDLLEHLSALVNSSLVRRERRSDGEERFGMLETVREYALARLAEVDTDTNSLADARRRHAEYYFNMVIVAKGDLMGPRQHEWMDRFEIEQGNLRAALGWARDVPSGQRAVGQGSGVSDQGLNRNPQSGLELALSAGAALLRFWQSRGHVGEGRQWLEMLLGSPEPVAPGIRAQALRSAGVLAFYEGDLEGSVRICEESLALYTQIDDELGRASLLTSLGNARRELGAYDQAIELYEQGLSIFRRFDDTVGISIIYNNLGATAQRQGDYARAAALYEESLELRRSAGDTLGIVYTLYKLAEAARDYGDFSRAVSACEESLAVSRSSGDRNGIAMAVLTLGTIRLEEGDGSAARLLLEESLTTFTDAADRWGIATVKHKLGSIAHASGNYERASELYQDSLAIFRDNGDRRAEAGVLSDLNRLAEEQAGQERELG